MMSNALEEQVIITRTSLRFNRLQESSPFCCASEPDTLHYFGTSSNPLSSQAGELLVANGDGSLTTTPNGQTSFYGAQWQLLAFPIGPSYNIKSLGFSEGNWFVTLSSTQPATFALRNFRDDELGDGIFLADVKAIFLKKQINGNIVFQSANPPNLYLGFGSDKKPIAVQSKDDAAQFFVSPVETNSTDGPRRPEVVIEEDEDDKEIAGQEGDRNISETIDVFEC